MGLFERLFDDGSVDEASNPTQREEASARIRDKIRRIKRWTKIGVATALGIGTLATTIYLIPPDSNGVVQRFGKYDRTTDSGPHLRLPWGIESITKIPVKKIQKETFGFRELGAGVDSEYLGSKEIINGKISDEEMRTLISNSGSNLQFNQNENLSQRAIRVLQSEYVMLTGDLNMADVEWIVQYRIVDPVAYLFNVKDPVQTLRDASLAVMRQIAGNGSVDEAITIGRIEYEGHGKIGLQEILDSYHSGMHIETVRLQETNPPMRVRDAFNSVNQAMQQKEEKINQAREEYNNFVPKAEGEALRNIQISLGYEAERVNTAKGDVTKYSQTLTSYRRYPDVTRERMLLETMTEILPRLEIGIVEQKGAEGGILMRWDIEKPSAEGR